MAGMALQCVKDSGSHVLNAAELHTALSEIKQKLLASRRPDGHIGNEFSTGLAVQVRILHFCLSFSLQTLTRQYICIVAKRCLFVAFKALLAMGTEVAECAASMEAMRTAARSNTYSNPMAISQTLPALQQTSYVAVKSKDCLHEDSTCSITSTLFGRFRMCLLSL